MKLQEGSGCSGPSFFFGRSVLEEVKNQVQWDGVML
jgi:hypothetical protein